MTMNVRTSWIPWLWIWNRHEFHDYELDRAMNSMTMNLRTPWIPWLWIWKCHEYSHMIKQHPWTSTIFSMTPWILSSEKYAFLAVSKVFLSCLGITYIVFELKYQLLFQFEKQKFTVFAIQTTVKDLIEKDRNTFPSSYYDFIENNNSLVIGGP